MPHKKYLLTLFLLCIPSLVWAEMPDLLKTTDQNTDLSIKYLAMLFGQVGTLLPFTDTMFGSLFKVFNTVILAMVSIVVGYATVVATVTTAHEGNVMGQKYSAMWVPFKALLGIALITPTKTGYCLFQILTMWVVLQGVGAANQVWGTILDKNIQGVSIIPITTFNDDEKKAARVTVENVFRAAVCKAAYIAAQNKILKSNEINKDNKDPLVILGFNPEEINPHILVNKNITTIGIGIQGDTNIANQSLCGSWEAPTFYSAKTNPDKTQKEIPYVISGAPQEYGPATSLQMQFIIDTFKLYENSANDLVTTKMKDWSPLPGLIKTPTQQYLMKLSSVRFAKVARNTEQWYVPLNSLPSNTADPDVTTAQMRKLGWLMAATSYFDLVYPRNQSNFMLPPAKIGIPAFDTLNKQSIDPSQPAFLLPPLNTGEQYPLEALVQMYMLKGDTTTTETSLNALTSSQNTSKSKSINDLKGFYDDSCANLALAQIEKITNRNNTLDPMLSMSQWGTQMMLDTEISLFVVIMVMLAVSLLGASNTGGSPVGIAIITALMVVGPILITILTMLWTAGAALGVYLPVLPFITYLFASMAWFIAVIEAMVAAPMVGVGLTAPSHSSDHLGKAAPSILLMANVFLRPTLMVIGLIVGGKLFSIGFGILHFTFSAAVKTNVALVTFFGAVLLVVIFVSLCLSLATKCFSMIYVLPDKILRWIGGQAESYGREIAGEMKSVERQGEAVTKQVGDALGSLGKMSVTMMEQARAKESEKLEKFKTPEKGDIDKMDVHQSNAALEKMEGNLKELNNAGFTKGNDNDLIKKTETAIEELKEHMKQMPPSELFKPLSEDKIKNLSDKGLEKQEKHMEDSLKKLHQSGVPTQATQKLIDDNEKALELVKDRLKKKK